MTLARLALVATCAALGVASAGCNDIGPAICDRSVGANPYVDYKGGSTTNGIYQSAPFDGELLYFPGGMHYALHHGLGRAPLWVQTYLSFEQFGTNGGPVSIVGGNEVEIAGVDEDTVKVDNGSCAEYWLLVVAGTSPKP